MTDLSLRGIQKRYGHARVINGVDIEIAHGEFVVFVGPSGCGKSTLLRMIAGLEEISAGELLIDGVVCNDVSPRDRGIAMVFQTYALYPNMTVYDNVGYSLKLARVNKDERDRKIREAARILQMEHLLERKPAQLSGGQRQRVAIGRAIVRQPKVFLFDEPLSNLDAALRGDMRMEIAKLHQDLGATMIYVTHDQVEAMTLADKIVILDRGMVQQVGAPLELYHHPANLFVAGFIGAPKMNLLPVAGQVAGGTLNLVSPDLRSVSFKEFGKSPGSPDLVLGLRPQDLKPVAPGTGKIAGQVILVEHLGSETVVKSQVSSGAAILATVPGDVSIKTGERIDLDFQQDNAHLFLATGAALERAGLQR